MKATYLLPFLGLVQARKPNILFILTDDQDAHMESVAHMPYLLSDIASQGTTFDRHFCTVALCCPSRASMWTGQAAHNTNITDVAPPHGGYGKIVERGINDNYLPVWMQQAGYNTYYAGKLWNFHSIDNYDDPYVKGFNASDFLLDPHTYRYYDAVLTHNGEPPRSFAGQYSTDVVAEHSYRLLDEALSHEHERPWFLTVAPIAPHSNAVFEPQTNTSYLVAPVSAPRHEHLFFGYEIPRDASYNVPIAGGASWVGARESLNTSVRAYNDHYQRQRLRALQAVDEMVHELVQKLDAAGELENTYIFYTTDNGYHISQHAMHPGKECGYDTDIHIPLLVRGPGIAAGAHIDAVTTHTDIATTLLHLAGVYDDADNDSRRPPTDGQRIPLTANEAATHFRTEHVAVEYWDLGIPEGIYGYRSDNSFEAGAKFNVYLNNTYKGLRLIGPGYSLYYAVWCTNETELYDLSTDPHQTTNLLGSGNKSSSFSVAGRSLAAVVSRLDALMMVLKDCKGTVCTRPWNVLHPDAAIDSLQHALAADFDAFYNAQPKMYFDSCELAFIPEKESRAHVQPHNAYTEGGRLRKQSFEYGNSWVLYI